MKFAIILSIFAVTLAREFDMKLDEQGEKFTEKVKIDIAGNTEEIKVPQHADRAELDMLNDFNTGYRAMKVKDAKACYISVMSKEQTPRQMERSMEKSHAKFPTDSYRVQNNKFVQVYNMTASEVGSKIAAHCAPFDMIFTVFFKKDSDVLKIIKSHSKRTKRASGFVEFTSCPGQLTIPNKCQTADHSLHPNLHTKCRMLRRGQKSCIYKIRCKWSNSSWRWVCGGDHDFNLPFCCKVDC